MAEETVLKPMPAVPPVVTVPATTPIASSEPEGRSASPVSEPNPAPAPARPVSGTVFYADGSSVTGTYPLPELSPNGAPRVDAQAPKYGEKGYPQVSKIVLFVPHGKTTAVPAIITAVHADGSVNLRVFYDNQHGASDFSTNVFPVQHGSRGNWFYPQEVK